MKHDKVDGARGTYTCGVEEEFRQSFGGESYRKGTIWKTRFNCDTNKSVVIIIN
jgi:hypothetical protein